MDASRIEEYRQRLRDPNTDNETRDLILNILSIVTRLECLDEEDRAYQDIRQTLMDLDNDLAKMQQDLTDLEAY